MSVACAVSVANIYYNQPLLPQMAASLQVSGHAIGYLPGFTQAGVAAGMFLFVPLGDMFPRRRLIILLSLAIALAVLLTALAPSLQWLYFAGFLTGITTIVPHLVLPFAAKLAPDRRRGQIVGTVLGGLLTGILLARVVSGFAGDWFGWRAVYFGAAVLMVILAALVRVNLPEDLPDRRIRYSEMLRSILDLVRTQPVLREASLEGAMLFGAFSAFWSTLVFHLAGAPYHYGGKVAGLFGLVGAAGAAFAPRAGHLSDRKGAGFTVSVSISVSIASYLVFAAGGDHLWGLIAGVILMDLGVQAGHVANQTRIYGLVPEARSRLNTVYMVSYFVGGAIGSALGAYGWQQAGWLGVCAAGIVQLLLAGVVRWRMGGPR